MKNFSILVIAALLMAMMASCGGNKTQSASTDDADTVSVSASRDHTIYGICGEGSAMNTLQLLTDNGDSITIDISAAGDKRQVFGGLQSGDRMAVVLTPGTKEAAIVINMSALLGRWVMPNPIDGSDEMGVEIKEGGIAESIDQSSIIYRTWRLVDGKLELTSVRDGGLDEEEVNLYTLISLGPDSLVFKDSEDTFEYGREKPRELYGTDVQLEGVSEDDYRI